MKKLFTVLIPLALIGGGVYYYYTYTKVVDPPTVNTMAISKGDITEVVAATGQLEAMKTVQVGSQVSGVVKDVYVDYNSVVHPGDLLAEIDDTLLQTQVKIQEASIQVRLGDIELQKINLADSEKNLERQKTSYEKGLATKQALESAEITVLQRKATIESSTKQLVSAQASLDAAKLNVDYCKIYSKVEGVVVERLVDKGQTVQASTTTPQFFRLATDLKTLKLSAGVDEAEIGKVRQDMDVDFTVESYGPQVFRGKVSAVRLNASTNNNVVTFPVWIDVPNGDYKLRPSMTASLKIIIRTAHDVVRVPNSATRFRPNADMYTALGLIPPTAGKGNANAAGGATTPPAGAPGAPPATGTTPNAGAPGAPPQTPPVAGDKTGSGRTPGQTGQSGQAGQGGSNRTRGQNNNAGGGGAGTGAFNRPAATPEQLAAMAARYGTAGRGGGQGGNQQSGRGGGGGRGGGRNGTPANMNAVVKDTKNVEKIDELFEPIKPQESSTQVWTWTPPAKPGDKGDLKETKIRTGVSDGTWSELISGDVQVGQKVVTSVFVPSATPKPGANPANPFGGQPQRGGQMPGMGGNPGGGGAGGGGRAPGGGGGGRGGGGN